MPVDPCTLWARLLGVLSKPAVADRNRRFSEVMPPNAGGERLG